MLNKNNSQYVGFWDRFHAILVVSVIFLLIEVILSFIFFSNFYLDEGELFDRQDIILGYIFPFILTVLVWVKYSTDPGKMLYKAKIVDATTFAKPSTKQFILRYVGYYLSLLPLGLGYFWIIWDDKKQSFHDKLAHTVVIQTINKNKKTKWYDYIYRILVIFFGFFILVGWLFSVYSSNNEILIKGINVEKEKIERLITHKIIIKEDELLYYNEYGIFLSPFIMITAITPDSICNISFMDTDETSMTINSYAFNEVGTLVVEEDEFGYIYLYDSDVYSHEYIFGDDNYEENITEYGLYQIVAVAEGEKPIFKKKIISLWKKSIDKKESK